MAEPVQVRREGISIPLSVGSIALVLAAAGGYVPAGWLPRAPDTVIAWIPHVNVLLSLFAIATIAYGWWTIRAGNITQHRRVMLIATGLFASFLGLYLYRLIILGGPVGFDGDPAIYRYVYLPVLTLHIGLAMICIPLLFDALALGLTVPHPDLPTTRHPRVGRVAAVLWITSFVLGIFVYLLLYWQ